MQPPDAGATYDEAPSQARTLDDRFCLTWEYDADERDRALHAGTPTLAEDAQLSRSVAGPDNLIIEGDNVAVLRALAPELTGQVRCIYIDPPYNTGNKDFIYADTLDDARDRFRHSAWLEFMYRRLILARALLADDGVIFVSIDDNELHYLGVLMDQIFQDMRIATFVWRRRSGVNVPNGAGHFASSDHEYVLCYGGPKFSFRGADKDFSRYLNPDGDPRGPWVRGDLTKGQNWRERPNGFYPIVDPATGATYAPNPNTVWRYASLTRMKPGQKLRAKPMETLISEGKVLFPRGDRITTYASRADLIDAIRAGSAPPTLRERLYPTDAENDAYLDGYVGMPLGHGSPAFKRHRCDVRRATKPVSTWIEPASGAAPGATDLVSGMTQEGTRLLQGMLGTRCFNHPKPLSLMVSLLRAATGPDDLVLDFFAGSGTTGHAVLALNAQDEGARRFILASNTEASDADPTRNLCRDVLRARICAAIDGWSENRRGRQVSTEGLGGGFRYLRATIDDTVAN